MATLTIPPPDCHRAYAPTIIRITGGANESTVNLTITDANDTSQSYRLAPYLLFKDGSGASYTDVDIQPYISGLFKHGGQSVTYRLSLGDAGKTYVAFRSAAQVGEATSMQHMLRKFLTDMDRLVAYSGYPMSVSYLSGEGDFIETAAGENTGYASGGSVGLSSLPVSCGMDSITIHKKRTYSPAYTGYVCQKIDEVLPVYEVEVSVPSGQRKYIDAGGGGKVTAGQTVNIWASLLDEEFFVIEGWLVDGVPDVSVPVNGAYKPTKEYTLLQPKLRQYRYAYTLKEGDSTISIDSKARTYTAIADPIPTQARLLPGTTRVWDSWYVWTNLMDITASVRNSGIPQNGSFYPMPVYQPTDDYVTDIVLIGKSKDDDTPYVIRIYGIHEHPIYNPSFYYAAGRAETSLPQPVNVQGTIGVGGYTCSFSLTISGTDEVRELVYTTEADPDIRDIEITSYSPQSINGRSIYIYS